MKIFLGADHAGFELKSELIDFLKAEGQEVTDFGAFSLRQDDDYPDFIAPVAKAVSANDNSRGIIIGGSGEGEAICANRFSGVRAAVFYGYPSSVANVADGSDKPDPIKLSREHNDANILSLGAWYLTFEEAKEAVLNWLKTDFSGGERHIRRLEKIDRLGGNGK